MSARVTTRIPMWHHSVTGEDFPVDAPDTVSASGILKNGGSGLSGKECTFNASGTRLEIYGRKGTLFLTSQSVTSDPAGFFWRKGMKV